MTYDINKIAKLNNLSIDEVITIVNNTTFYDLVRNKIGFGNKNEVKYLLF